MKIELDTLLENEIIDSGKMTELRCNGKVVWKGLSENVSELSSKYSFVNFNNERTNEFNESVYKINVTEKNKFAFLEDYSKSKKSKTDADMEYGVPEEQKFPLFDKNHVLSAIKFFNYVNSKYESELADAIKTKMNKYGITSDHVGEDNKLKKYLTEDASTDVVNNLRSDLQGELTAIKGYEKHADIAEKEGLSDIADVLRDISKEEKVHCGELQAVLDKHDNGNAEAFEDGEKEAKETIEEQVGVRHGVPSPKIVQTVFGGDPVEASKYYVQALNPNMPEKEAQTRAEQNVVRDKIDQVSKAKAKEAVGKYQKSSEAHDDELILKK